MARPTLYNEDLCLRLCQALEEGQSIADACALCGIGETTYHQWVKKGDDDEPPFVEFAELTRQARARGRAVHVRAISRCGKRTGGRRRGFWSGPIR